MEQANHSNNPRETVRTGGRAVCQQPQQQRGRIIPIIVIIALDVTGSMGFAIEAIIRALQRFVDILEEGDLDPYIGLVMFRDELCGEAPEIYPVGTSPEDIKRILSRTTASGGGDVPESSLPAIMHGLGLLPDGPADAKRVFLHITDAPPHDPEAGHTAKSVLDALKQEQVVFFACCPQIEPYTTFVNVTGGTLFPLTGDIGADAFKDVLLSMAHATVKTMRMDAVGVSDDVRDLLRRTAQER